MRACDYWDCGWCYAPEDVKTTDTNGQCNNPTNCPQRHDIIATDKDGEDDD